MEILNEVKVVYSTEGLKQKVKEGENVVVLTSQGLSGKPCIFIRKDFFNQHAVEVGKMIQEFQLKAMRNDTKKRLLGKLCIEVHGLEADPVFLSKLNPDGVEQYAKENTLHKCKPSSIPVAPI